ncbi:hypothetical protein [Rubrobacter tropicus]|uniref:hypothetical protein n=1 Tax=Rubrobacter tropicus TaxID=2653851 RepID=UPI001408E2F4|nr:hypothetical protein [Rubrobacter tropicus]
MSPEIVALLVLLGGVVAAVVFTLVIVIVVNPANANTRPPNGDDGTREQQSERP